MACCPTSRPRTWPRHGRCERRAPPRFSTPHRLPCTSSLGRSPPSRPRSQVTLRHPHAHGLAVALAAHGVVADMRAPDLLRFGVNALFTSYRDLLTAASRLRDLTLEGAYDPAPPSAGLVT
ncbi:kynureninase/PvdN C-terminal domain-containing protein [Streptomyces althioticus]|uniref:kynureninase/PvdN C-terminal domain-containing protein n=1 Tax=Streptomyces althioticus TaxID=83380 RepID=UPI003F53E78A